MEYLLLIYSDEEAWAALPDDERNAIIEEYFALTNELQDHGIYIGGAPLRSTMTASTVRIRDAEQLVTDGPFTETKEQLGGYFLADCKDLDQAIELAQRVPVATTGSVEIRPLAE
jgi:hypothetical protein